MDVISEVLRVVRLEGALFFNAEFSAPWRISSAASASFAPYLCPGAEHLMMYHFLTEGRAYLELLALGTRVELSAGDVVMLPHGDAHYLGNGSAARTMDGIQAMTRILPEGLKLLRFGAGGETTRFVCGYLACEPRLCDVILTGLPRVLKIELAKHASGQWLEHAIRFAVGPEGAGYAGGGLIVTKLSELLFLETLRCYISALPPQETGWLAGARDPVVGQALASLHKEAAEPWTIAELARRSGTSRSRLTERFRRFLGVSPMAYLASWRLKLGASLLLSGEDTVAQIAASVGYGSEPAFNRAFKREFGCPPAQFRRERKDPVGIASAAAL